MEILGLSDTLLQRHPCMKARLECVFFSFEANLEGSNGGLIWKEWQSIMVSRNSISVE